MLRRYPVPPAARFGKTPDYSHQQYQWMKGKFGPKSTLSYRYNWRTPWDDTAPVIYWNYRMVGEYLGISRAHAFQILHRQNIKHDAISGTSKGWFPETIKRLKVSSSDR